MSSHRLVVSLAVATVLVLAPSSAHADSSTTRDASRDVLSQGLEDDVPTRPEPSRAEGDALTMRVTHGPKRLRIVPGVGHNDMVSRAGKRLAAEVAFWAQRI